MGILQSLKEELRERIQKAKLYIIISGIIGVIGFILGMIVHAKTSAPSINTEIKN